MGHVGMTRVLTVFSDVSTVDIVVCSVLRTSASQTRAASVTVDASVMSATSPFRSA
ncbi:hypothetical protein [Rathayibacter tritici]|uniref:hypothetical protein n=1 Tax=Rathayibacter tritici TaxID=33888 RepID=UPI0014750CC2|nr:hypothetical protein [Rathayibacter tritici]